MAGGRMLSEAAMGIVNAFQYGSARNYTTIQTALDDISTRDAMLLVPFDGDGIWTINSNVTIPTNVTLIIVPGVIWAGTGNLTINGQLLSYTLDFYQGSGTITPSYGITSIGAIQTQRLAVNTSTPTVAFEVYGTANVPARVRLDEGITNTVATIDFASGGTLRGAIGLAGDQNIKLTLLNSAKFVTVGGIHEFGGFVGIGMTPSVQLELSGSVAYKASGTTWASPSSKRIKKDIRPFTDGLDVLLAIEPVIYQHNGLGGVIPDGEDHIGVIAEDLAPVAPYMVRPWEAKLAETDLEPTAMMAYDGNAMQYLLLNAIKELQAQIAALTTRVEALEPVATPHAVHAPRKRARASAH